MKTHINDSDATDLIAQMNCLIKLGGTEDIHEFEGMRKALRLMGYEVVTGKDGRVEGIEPEDGDEEPEHAVITMFTDGSTSVRYVKGSDADAMREASSDMASVCCVTVARCCGFVGVGLDGKPMVDEF